MLPDLVNEGSTVEEYRYSPCENEGEVMLLKVINGGHTWPGSSGSGLGNTNRDIDASEEIWRFFSRFKKGMTPTGTIDHGSGAVHFYPNPATSHLSFEMKKAITEVDIISIDGRTLLHVINSGGSFELYVDNLPAGTYMLRVRNQGNVLLRKFVKI
jgi:polyhydroxybutyrate depolymerase